MKPSRLILHMATLAKADEVVRAVGFLGRGKEPEGANVVDWKGPAKVLPALRTAAVLALDDGQSDTSPISSSVAILSPLPERRKFARHVNAAMLISALAGAIDAATRSLNLVRLALIRFCAKQARELDRFDPFIVVLPAPDGRFALRDRFELPKLVEFGGFERSVARSRAEAGSVRGVGIDAELLAATLASLEHGIGRDVLSHGAEFTTPARAYQRPFAGTGVTGEAALLEGFGAVLIEREAEHVADIRRRLGRLSGADTPLFADQDTAA